MKTKSSLSPELWPVLCLAASLVSSLPSALAVSSGSQLTLLLKPDGTGLVRTEQVTPRLILEQQVRMWAKLQEEEADSDTDTDEEDDVPQVPPPPTATDPMTKPFTDEELARQLREMYQKGEASTRAARYQIPGGSTENPVQIETIDVKSNTVRIVSSTAAKSLEEFITQSDQAIRMAQLGIQLENLRIEKDADSHLRITLTPPAGGEKRWHKQWRQYMKASGMNNGLRFELPGKVLGSGLPHTATNSTWLTVDSSSEQSLDGLLKLMEAPIVITAELGALMLNQPLDSKSFRQAASRHDSDETIPLTDAGPGYVAEASGVTTTTRFYFPDGEKHLKGSRGARLAEPGVVVRAKLFPPKGRALRSLKDLRIVQATDDKGRTVAPADTNTTSRTHISYSGSSSERTRSMPIELRLALPQADAKLIEEIRAEAIAVTIGGWKELTLTNLSQQISNEVSLASVLPGASLVIQKLSSKRQQTTVQAKISGPPSIRDLDLKIQVAGQENSHSSLSDRSSSNRGAQAVRNVTIQTYNFEGGRGGAGAQRPMTLRIRYPEDIRRERVQFKLESIDLY